MGSRPAAGLAFCAAGLALCALTTPVAAQVAKVAQGVAFRSFAYETGGVADAAGLDLSSAARVGMQVLWHESVGVKQERVACIGGYVSGGVAHITRVAAIDGMAIDSAHISAANSLRACGPPEWLGTVHTHVATFGGLPFVTFSADDRMVMGMWRRMWKADGVFCVIYTASDAHCESGSDVSVDVSYAAPRGNAVLP